MGDPNKYNNNAQIFDSQFVIRNSTTATSSTCGGLIVEGGIAARDTYVRGDIVANEVKITPNLGDISKEIRVDNLQSVVSFTDIHPHFKFYNDTSLAFNAMVFVNTASGTVKNAVWQINGVLIANTWYYNANFTGDFIDGFDLQVTSVAAGNGVGAHASVQYISTTPVVITFHAETSSNVDPITQISIPLVTNDFVPPLTKSFNYIYANIGTAFVISDTNDVYGWGQNDRGHVGTGTTNYINSPYDITGQFTSGGTITSIKNGYQHTHAISSTNRVYSLGSKKIRSIR